MRTDKRHTNNEPRAFEAFEILLNQDAELERPWLLNYVIELAGVCRRCLVEGLIHIMW